jgi:hypothetical protein
MERTMPRWAKRLKACEYAGIGRTKLDEMIRSGRVSAKKDEGGRNAPVYVNLDSIDEMYAAMRDAKGSPPKHHRQTQAALSRVGRRTRAPP